MDEEKMTLLIKRELTQLMPPSGKPTNSSSSGNILCESPAELINTFETMYRLDKMAFDYLKDQPVHRGVSDESRHPGTYSFSLYNRLLTVSIDNFDKIANRLFGFKEGEKHGRW